MRGLTAGLLTSSLLDGDIQPGNEKMNMMCIEFTIFF